MATLTMSHDGSIHLPDSIRDRYGFIPDRPLRIIETPNGILILRLTDEPMDVDLARELEEWKALSQETPVSNGPELSSSPQFELVPYPRNISDQDLIGELLRVASLLERNSVTIVQFNKLAKFQANFLIRRFGSWFKANVAAGLGKSINRNITNEQLFENLAALWLKLGRQPKFRDLANEGSSFSASTYHSRFGTWNGSLAAFVAWANEGKLPEINSVQLSDSRQSRTPRNINWRLRALVLMRDGARCQLCGAEARNGAKLQVDHVMPWAKGGETTLENLQILCHVCNIGKSDTLLEVRDEVLKVE